MYNTNWILDEFGRKCETNSGDISEYIHTSRLFLSFLFEKI